MDLFFFQNSSSDLLTPNEYSFINDQTYQIIYHFSLIIFLRLLSGVPCPLAFVWSGCLLPNLATWLTPPYSSILDILILGFLCLSLLWSSSSNFFKCFLVDLEQVTLLFSCSVSLPVKWNNAFVS